MPGRVRLWWRGVLYPDDSAPSSLDSTVSMDYAYQAQPFAEGPVDPTVSLVGMDYAYQGQPFAPYVVL